VAAIVLEWAIGDDGLFVQPKSYTSKDEVEEAHGREMFQMVFHYADMGTTNPRQFDPTGNYLCGECNKFDGPSSCLLVEGDDISAEHGSCGNWENIFDGDPELRMARKISKQDAGYGTTKAKGFGCFRCMYHEEANQPDSKGRDKFCKQGRIRVFAKACCVLNNSPDVTEFKGNSPIKVSDSGFTIDSNAGLHNVIVRYREID
jgi:hypothetical protein